MDDPTVAANEYPTTPTPPLDMVRSEEQLRVATHTEIAERLRISKRVITEERVVTVQVRREELVVENLPVDSEQQHTPQDTAQDTRRSLGALDSARADVKPVLELLLSEEEVQISTRVVPRERVRVFIDTVTDSVHVSEDVAQEVIEVDTPNHQEHN